MFKKTGLVVLGLVLLVSVLFILEAQSEEKGWKKTVTLPNGEVVCDLSGQWDYEFQGKGELKSIGRIVDIYEISQQEGSFKGISLKGTEWKLKGSLVIEGALDKNGISMFKWYGPAGLDGSYQAKLSKDGNLIEWRGSDFFVELTRK
jgi:hypothetical protein